jgi:hypothetical protein
MLSNSLHMKYDIIIEQWVWPSMRLRLYMPPDIWAYLEHMSEFDMERSFPLRTYCHACMGYA